MVFLELQDHAGEITAENTVRSAAEHKDCKARNARAGNWENKLVAVHFLLLPSVILGACGAGGHLGGGALSRKLAQVLSIPQVARMTGNPQIYYNYLNIKP